MLERKTRKIRGFEVPANPASFDLNDVAFSVLREVCEEDSGHKLAALFYDPLREAGCEAHGHPSAPALNCPGPRDCQPCHEALARAETAAFILPGLIMTDRVIANRLAELLSLAMGTAATAHGGGGDSLTPPQV